MKVIIIKNKRIILSEVIAENGKKYYINLDSLNESKNINEIIVMWNYVKNKLRNLIKVCRDDTE